nr:hypothetical protein [Tanacetum cinerariifolium]
MTVDDDDDEVAPRRNAGRAFKVADQNLLTTMTMDDEDATGLKALLVDNCSITEFVYLVEAHHHLNPIFVPKDNSPRRLDDGVVMLVLD